MGCLSMMENSLFSDLLFLTDSNDLVFFLMILTSLTDGFAEPWGEGGGASLTLMLLLQQTTEQ